MKRIFLAAALLIGISATAQTTVTDTLTTVGATGAKTTLVTPANYFAGNNGVWTASLIATKISGTIPAATYAILQTSPDGTNWVPRTGTAADSFTIANSAGAQLKTWDVSGSRPIKSRIYITQPSGTASFQVKSAYVKN